MDKDAGLVVFVVGIATKVIALLDQKARLAMLRGETLGNRQPGEPATDDEAVAANIPPVIAITHYIASASSFVFGGLQNRPDISLSIYLSFD